ncbi:hypothetical protein BHE74_00031144 [Ensete ventricosum]|nr:hypothetical protein BHE74_00031144 [Ensete ventricosum]
MANIGWFQGPYYCAVGADKSFGRDISDAHYKACLYAGINISGTNGEILFLFNLLTNIEDGQELIKEISILKSVFSLSIFGNIRLGQVTKSMREEGGYEVIKKAILNLSLRHMDHISAYGEGNERRLTGKHETANINTFSWVRPPTPSPFLPSSAT